MELLKKYWWVVLIVIVAVVFLRKKKQDPAFGSEFVTNTGEQQNSVPEIDNSNFTTDNVGTSDAPGIVITGKMCRQICRGRCGKRCIVPIGRKCKTKRDCWRNCKADACGYVS